MIHYTFSRIDRFLCETSAPIANPQVSLGPTRYFVHMDSSVHQVRRDGVCSCGATFKSPCKGILAVQDFLDAGGGKPLGRNPETWPDSWDQIRELCPVCDCAAIPDRCLDSRAGPGWRCMIGPSHFWQVRVERLRRLQRRYPPQSTWPWYDTPIEEQVWTPRAPKNAEGDNGHALHRSTPCEGGHRAGVAVPWLDPIRLLGGPVRLDDGLLLARELAGDRRT